MHDTTKRKRHGTRGVARNLLRGTNQGICGRGPDAEYGNPNREHQRGRDKNWPTVTAGEHAPMSPLATPLHGTEVNSVTAVGGGRTGVVGGPWSAGTCCIIRRPLVPIGIDSIAVTYDDRTQRSSTQIVHSVRLSAWAPFNAMITHVTLNRPI